MVGDALGTMLDEDPVGRRRIEALPEGHRGQCLYGGVVDSHGSLSHLRPGDAGTLHHRVQHHEGDHGQGAGDEPPSRTSGPPDQAQQGTCQPPHSAEPWAERMPSDMA